MKASTSNRQSPRKSHWIRSNGFILGLGIAVALAFLFPATGAHGGILHAEVVNMAGIALILFLQGLSLAFEKIRSSAANWRMHVTIQAFTFVVFPIAGLLLDLFVPWIWPGEPDAIRKGILFLCVLPSTVSTSVVLTAAAGGNTAGALFNAAFSNIIGVVATPVLVHLLMRASGSSAGNFGPLLLQIVLLTLVPFALGILLRRKVAARVDARKPWINRASNGVILFMVYSAFCDSVQERIWQSHGWLLTGQVLLLVALLFAAMSLLVLATGRALKMERADEIATYFCSVKKTLAMGVPLAALIFGNSPDLPLILLPIMFYHPLQLLVNGILANHWARQIR